MLRLLACGIFLLTSCLMTSCGHVQYLLQAAHGQLALVNHAKPIEEVVKDERTPPRIRELLKEISAIKKFGEQQGLKPTRNYQEYVKLDRSSAVWVVSACQELDFSTKTWGFPVVGSFPYLGWFDQKSALAYGDELKREGWDVYVRGARAYSTLGWFHDAVLSTMIAEGPGALGDLVDVILHESVHSTLYIKGQSYFNESLAEFVSNRMTVDYLELSRGRDSLEKKAYLKGQDYGLKFSQKMHEGYLKLEALYRSTASREEKLQRKKQILEALKEDLKIKSEMNNARLIQHKTYNSGTAAFERIFKESGGNWTKFLDHFRTLGENSFKKSQDEDFDRSL